MVKVHDNKYFVMFRHDASEKYALESPAIYSMIPVERPGIGTMAVDKYYRVYYDPKFLESIASDEDVRKSLWTRCDDRPELPEVIPAYGPNGAGSYCCTHEVDHLLGNHVVRAESMGLTPDNKELGELFNIAWDIAIEWQKRKDYGYIFTGGAHAEAFNVDGNLPGEAIYAILKQRKEDDEDINTGEPNDPMESWENPQDDDGSIAPADPQSPPPSQQESEDSSQQGGSDSGGASDSELENKEWDQQSPLTSGSCSNGQQQPWELPAPEECNTPGLDEVEQEQVIREVADNIKHDAEHGDGANHTRLEWAKDVLRSNVDIAAIVRRFVRTGVAKSSGSGGRTWRRTKRYRPHPDVELPSSKSLIPDVVVIVDTSGSMCSTRTAGIALGAVDKTIKGFQQRGKVRVLTGDTEVSTVNLAGSLNDVLLSGGGGTNMGKLVLSASELRPKPDAIVVITDGYTPWCDRISIPVFAVITDSISSGRVPPSWIKYINISMED